ncbi:DUF721 domain-containing protein [Candidatus Dependentiae bacterium]|nr:DUF721 domain-containing protein [Candidatus Dependentiae bacterium]
MSNSIKNILNKFVHQNDDKFTLFKNWHEISGQLNTKIRLEKIYDDTCIIGVNDSAWMQELHLMSKLIISKINKVLNEHSSEKKLIKNLRFKLVEQKKIKEDKNNFKSLISNIPEKDETISEDIKSELEKIKDSELKKSIESYLLICLRNSK